MRPRALSLFVTAVLTITSFPAFSADPCAGTPLPDGGGSVDRKPLKAWKLDDGGLAAYSRMNINIDGYARAYHRKNREAGAVLHLCNGANVWLPGAAKPYGGADSNAICTGKFMEDLARIEAAGWTDPTVGVVEWYGVVAEGSVKMGNTTVRGVKPVLQRDGSGFYVSPTSLVDKSVTDLADQRRYVDPLRVAGAVVPRKAMAQGITLGSYGVAINTKGKAIAVPFVVFDAGPAVGEGSPALARQVAGKAPSDTIDLKTRFEGQVDAMDVLWIFFGGPAQPYDHTKEAQVAEQAKAAFERWGGQARLDECVKAVPR